MSTPTPRGPLSLANQINLLRAALDNEGMREQARAAEAIQRCLFYEGHLDAIFDERLLATLVFAFKRYYGETGDESIYRLNRHLDSVRAIHDNLYAILDHDVDIDELLYLRLSEWPHLNLLFDCEYLTDVKKQLNEIRKAKEDPVQRLRLFFKTFFEYLRNQNQQDAVNALQPVIESAVQCYSAYHDYQIYALFTFPQHEYGEVHGIKLDATPNDNHLPQIFPFDDIGPQMTKAAKHSLACATHVLPKLAHYNFRWDIARNDVKYDGESIGLALTVGLLSLVDHFDIDAYTAFTGHVDWSTHKVGRIERLQEKLQAAKHFGFRRVLIPRANFDEYVEIDALTVIPVASVEEALEWFRNRSFERAKTPVQAKMREFVLALRSEGIQLLEKDHPQEFRTRLVFTDNMSRVPVDVFHGRKGVKVQVGGKASTLKSKIEAASDKVFLNGPSLPAPSASEKKRSSYEPQDANVRAQIEEYLIRQPACIRENEKNCDYRIRLTRNVQTVFVRQFSSGKLTIDGHVPLFDEVDSAIRGLLGITAHTPGMSDKSTRQQAQITAVHSIDLGNAWIGTDESGKGDYFGPLVSAAVFVDLSLANKLTELGVTDSKKLSDKRINELAPQIYRLCGDRCQVISLPPETYNLRYEEFKEEGKNLNTLLAWMHTRALENIIQQFKPQGNIVVVIDKFADEQYIHGKLLGESRQAQLCLVQLPKAEANVAVAAASVMARAYFLSRMKALSQHYQIEFPKGSSDPRVLEVAREIVAKYGPNELGKVAKLHFRTTDRVLSR